VPLSTRQITGSPTTPAQAAASVTLASGETVEQAITTVKTEFEEMNDSSGPEDDLINIYNLAKGQ